MTALHDMMGDRRNRFRLRSRYCDRSTKSATAGVKPRGTKQVKAPEEYRFSKLVSTVREIVTTFSGPQPSGGESQAVPMLNCTVARPS